MNAEQTILLRNSTSTFHTGKVDNQSVAYVDWNNALSNDWIRNQLWSIQNLGIDGILVQNNVFLDESINKTIGLDTRRHRFVPEVFLVR